MPAPRRSIVIAALRDHIIRGLRAGSLRVGDRLRSTREVARDLRADPRVIAAAYRVLETEGLVSLRPRSGVFVAPVSTTAHAAHVSRDNGVTEWAVNTLVAAIACGVPLFEAAARLATLTTASRIRVVVAASIRDQIEGLVRELKEDFGIAARAVLIEPASRLARWPGPLARASLVITTPAHAERLARLPAPRRVATLVAGVRTDLVAPEWHLVARDVAFLVIADPRFAPVVREFLSRVPGGADVAIRVAGRDALADVAPDCPIYVTTAAKRILRRTRIPGRLLPPVRTLDAAATRQIVAHLVASNLSPRPVRGALPEAR